MYNEICTLNKICCQGYFTLLSGSFYWLLKPHYFYCSTMILLLVVLTNYIILLKVLTQLHVLDIKFAEFIEASISNHHKFSFIVQTKSDMLLLKQKCKDEQNLLINILLAPPVSFIYSANNVVFI
jgi:hypothetical protein